MQRDEDCRTAGFGKTERPVGWEGDGELSRVKLVRHCERGKPAGTDRLHLQALSHPFTLDVELLLEPMGFPPAKTYQKALFEAGIPLTLFAVEDIQKEYERMKKLGVVFKTAP